MCHIFIEISMNENGMVKTQSNKSEHAKLMMNMFRGDKTCGFRMTVRQMSELLTVPNRIRPE